MSDVNPPNWNVYEEYRRGEQRWLATHSCYEIAAKLSPMAVFEMCGCPVHHKAVLVLISHSVEFELDRFTGPNLLRKLRQPLITLESWLGTSIMHSHHC